MLSRNRPAPNAGADQFAVDLEVFPALRSELAHDANGGAPSDAGHEVTLPRHHRPLSRKQVHYLAIVLQLEAENARE